MKTRHALLVAFAMVVLAATPAMAKLHHDQPPAISDQKPMGMDMMPMMGQGGMMMPVIGKADHIEGRLAFLKTELKITDAQLTLWNAFSDVVRSSAAQMPMMSMMKSKVDMKAGDAKPNLPERIAMHEKMMSSRLEMLGKIKTALLPLYAAFSDEQKQTADGLLCSMDMM